MQLYDRDVWDMLTRVFDPGAPLTIVDGGAWHGVVAERICSVFPRATVYAFEPAPACFAELVRTAARRPAIRPVNAALDDVSGEVEFSINNRADTSSVLPASDRLKRYWGDIVAPAERRVVPRHRLDAWAASAGVDRIDAMKLDLQGLEARALSGAGAFLDSITAVYAEAQIVPLYDGAATLTDIDMLLRSRGMVLHQIHHIFSNGVEQQTTCCDALWLRADALRQLHAAHADQRGHLIESSR